MKSIRWYQGAYGKQKYKAKLRGILWDLTFQEWYGWWGDDLVNRGSNPDDLCMCRFEDKGAYALSNIYKDTVSNNCRDASVFKRHPKKLDVSTEQEVEAWATSELSTRKVAAHVGVSKSFVHKIWQTLRK